MLRRFFVAKLYSGFLFTITAHIVAIYFGVNILVRCLQAAVLWSLIYT